MKLHLPSVLLLLTVIGNPSAKDQAASTAQPSYHPFKSAQAKEKYLAFNDTLSKKWPVVGETRIVETSYGKTFIRISGPVNAAPLVLLPGGGANSLMWRSNVEAFSEYFRVYAVDNIHDFGRSVYIRPFKNSDDFSNWLNELFSKLSIRDCVNLMGMSYGGWITSQYALHNSKRLDKIILLAPSATILPIQREFIVRVLLSLIHPNLSKAFFNWIFADLVHKDEEGRQRVDEVFEETDLSIHCFKPIKLVIPTVLKNEELHNMRVSSLFVVGENEKLYSAKKAIKRLNKVAPQIKTEFIPAAGHDMIVTQADRVDSLILHFLLAQK